FDEKLSTSLDRLFIKKGIVKVNFYDKEISNEFIEVIVVDNASVDNSVHFIKKENLKVKIIANKENYGFSKGNNIGVKEAQGKYVLFLNSDTRIQDKGFLRMVEFLDLNDRVAILGAKLENSDKSTQKSAGYFYNVFNLAILLFGGGKFGFLRKTPSRISRIDWVSGAALMARRDIFKKIGGFEEKLFMYMEDMDLCYRAKKIGINTYVFPRAKALHLHQGSSTRSFAVKHIYKGLLYFYKKN
ncbi:MAG: glycosyltransferase family 2 protein, partial [Alcaligenaceae bacterium]